MVDEDIMQNIFDIVNNLSESYRLIFDTYTTDGMFFSMTKAERR